MSYFWHISEKYRNTLLAKVFSGLTEVFSLQGEKITRSPYGRVIKVKIDNNYLFVKLYSRGGKRLRRFWGRSRVRAEWENLSLFHQLGIPTANIVAYGQESKWGRFKRGALITEELKNTTDMAALATNRSPLLMKRDWIRQVSLQVSDFTKKMHNSGFVHYDLKWRNILVTCGQNPQVFFIDCPTGRKWFGPVLRRGIIKDLACLDKVAKQQLSRTARLWFYKSYSGHKKLTKADKVLIKKILAFFTGHE